MASDQQTPRLYSRTRTNLLGSTVAVFLVVGITSLLYARADMGMDSGEAHALPVATTRFQLEDSYAQELSFLGIIRAGRKSDLGFERAGRLETIHVREGSRVVEGEVLASLDVASLQARARGAKADLARVSAELELATIKEKRQKGLRDSGAVSSQDYDETRLRQKALLAQREQVQAQLDQIDLELDRSMLRAPYSGIISEQYIDVGTVVGGGTAIVKVLEHSRPEAYVGVGVEVAATLLPGREYTVEFRGNTSQATLLAVRPDVDPLTRAVTAVLQLPEGRTAMDGEPVSLRLETTVDTHGGWVPLTALIEGDRGAWTVFKVEENQHGLTAVKEAVEVIATMGDRAYVRGTIVDGDTLVASGLLRVSPGTIIAMAEQN